MKRVIYFAVAIVLLLVGYFVIKETSGQVSTEAVKINSNLYMITSDDASVGKYEPISLSGLDNYELGTQISYDYVGGIKESYPAQAEVKKVKVLNKKLTSYTADINSAMRIVRLLQTDVEFIDVREVDEFEENHIEGAKNIPLGELEERAGDDIRKDVAVFLYCRSGNRSKTAQAILEDSGYFVIDMGGIIDYKPE